MTSIQPAKIITFYSYKGGTGRSMALANFAWILALQGKRVLAIDWDVEAPGLHRYFRPFLIDKDLRASTGVIDFAVAFASESVKPADESLAAEWYVEHADISEHAVTLDWEFAGGGSIDFVPAGRQDATYATRVSTFSWQNFYENLGGGALIDAMRKVLREKGEYDVVLIDSRTGVSDTAGICTVQLPDVLVCCFTYNNQSTDGASAIAASAQQLRRQPEYARGGLEDLVVYPIPMRVDPFEEDRLRERQAYAWGVFAPILPSNVSVPRKYWTEVEVPYKPALSYEEQLTVFRDEASDPKSALTAFLRACGYIFGPDAASLPLVLSPDERHRVIAEFAQTGGASGNRVVASAESMEEAAARKAETIFQRLPPDEQAIAHRFFLAMVRATEAYETSTISSFRIRRDDLDATYLKVASAFIEGGVLKNETEAGTSYIVIGSPALLFGWQRLLEWTHDASGFLSWRQRLRTSIEEARIDNTQLLSGAKLKDAQWWLKRRGDDLLPYEVEFIARSQRSQMMQRFLGVAIALLFIAVISYVTYNRSKGPAIVQPPPKPAQTPLAAEKIVLKALSLDDPLQTALLLAEVKTEPANAGQYLPAARTRMQQNIPRVVLRGHNDVVRTVDFSPDDSLILTAGDDQRMLVWGATNGDLRASSMFATVHSSTSGPPSITGARFIDANTIALLDDDNNASLVDLTGRVFSKRPGAGKAWRLAGYDPNTQKLVYYSPSDITISDKQNKFIQVAVRPVSQVIVTKGLIAAAGTSTISFWTMNGERSGFSRKNFPVTAMAFAEDNTLFAEAFGTVWRIDHDSPDNTKLFATPLTNVTAMAVTAKGPVVVGNVEGKVVARFLDGRDYGTYPGHRGAIRDIRISHSFNLLATASEDGTVRIWDGLIPETPKTFVELGKSVASRSTACLSAEERSLLLGENAADAYAKAAACDKQHGRVYAPPGAKTGL